ncbi:MAG: proline iminopeptidase, partial [Flavobacteriales bacterium]|nr:proline iminopeptidase [Flavobacteriales bacterium]
MKRMILLTVMVISCMVLLQCTTADQSEEINLSHHDVPQEPSIYLNYEGKDDVLSGGVKMIPISTEKGEFNVWTKRIGNNPTTKVLLLHGGPGATHEYFECFDSYFPNADIEYYYYDQLESAFSDQPS